MKVRYKIMREAKHDMNIPPVKRLSVTREFTKEGCGRDNNRGQLSNGGEV